MPKGQKGEQNGRARLTDDEVQLLRDLRDGDRFTPLRDRFWTRAKLAETFEISISTVNKIISGERR